ncbi:MAG: histidine kinase dimerization/phospho-acceptor domain-containing protein [Gallintestinimicrobium sp.]
MRREFLSNVSHELKTPIALIQGYAEGLLEDVNSDPESRKFYCDVIVDEAAKMNNMVKASDAQPARSRQRRCFDGAL